jgi:DNA/RNA-binding domain of Phe-tRNA-synthetase-like protein
MDLDSIALGLDPRVAAAGVKVAYLLVGGLDNHAGDDAFADEYRRLQEVILRDDTLAAVRADPRISGYRSLHETFGVGDAAMTPSPESIFRVLFEHGALRPINPLVDVYNFVSLKYRISAGAHDLDKIPGAVDLTTTRGDERFVPLGRAKPTAVPAGEYAYVDGDGEVLCRLECRQSEKTKIESTTRNALFILQGHAAIPMAAMTRAVGELKDLLGAHCGRCAAERLVVLPPDAS